MDKFLSCDWGTSTFRLRLIDRETLTVIAEEKNDNGVAKTHRHWLEEGSDANTRQTFYGAIIATKIKNLSKRLNNSFAGIPVIISGMISSAIGMIDIPYKEVPVALDGSDLLIKRLFIDGCDNELIIISGIKTADNIMRGEETQVIGCSFFADDAEEILVVFPGTHSKHVIIKNRQIIDFKTYMTGEFFDLLSTQSILSASIQKNDTFNTDEFKNGVTDSMAGDLLQTAFRVRTNTVLKNMPKDSNWHYLSGLVIGNELKSLLNYNHPVYLCGGNDLMHRYQLACDVLGITISLQIDSTTALLSGQKYILNTTS